MNRLSSYAVALASAALVPVGRVDGQESTSGDWVSIRSLDSSTADERAAARRERERLAWEAAVAALPDGWTAREVAGVKVMYREARHAKAAAGRVKAVMSWLEDTFAFVGTGEYVRTPILRVCRDAQEVETFRSAGETADWQGTEIVLSLHPPPERSERARRGDAPGFVEWTLLDRAPCRCHGHGRDGDRVQHSRPCDLAPSSGQWKG